MKKLKRILSIIMILILLTAYLPVLQASGAESWLWPVPRSTYGPSSTASYINIRGGDTIVATKSGTVVYVYSGCNNNSALTSKKACSSATCNPSAGYYTNSDYKIKLCNWGYGNGFVLKHSDGSGYSFYGHMGSVSVKTNQTVTQGAVVGTMGGSGLSFDNNLYFAAATNYTKSGTYYYPKSANAINVNNLTYTYYPSSALSIGTPYASGITNKSATFNCRIQYNATYLHSIGVEVYNSAGILMFTQTLETIKGNGAVDRVYSYTPTSALSPDSEYSCRFYARVSARNSYSNIKSNQLKIKTLPPDPESVSLDKTKADIYVGETVKLKSTVLPAAASQTVTWSSSDTSVATVSSDGTVSAKKAGTVTITATTVNGLVSKCTVYITVKAVPATKVTLNKSAVTLKEGTTEKLTATLTPAASTDYVTWKSSDSSVASVSNGTITAKKAGTATITATSTSGKTATCTVTVTKQWTKSNQYHFGNFDTCFTTGRYTMRDEEFNRLCNYVKKEYGEANAASTINTLTAMRYDKLWRGSCYGMAVTALLDFEDRISMMENFDPDAATIYDVDKPYKNEKVQSAINYYHISQKIGFIGNEDGAMYSASDANWKEGLIGLVSKAQDNYPMLFCYWFSKGGHAIIIKSYGGTDNNGNHKLVAYDNRYPTKDITVLVDKNYTYCTINGTEVASGIQYLTDYSVFDKIDIDGPLNNMAISYKNGNSSLKNTQFSVTVNDDITIWDDNNKYISIKDGKISGTMDIISKRLIVHSTAEGGVAPAEIVFTVADCDAFTFQCDNTDLQASVLSFDSYTQLDATDVTAATISRQDGVSVSGNKSAFTVHQSVDDSDCEMFSFSGVSTGVSTINYDNGSIYVSGNNPGDITVGKFNDSDFQQLVFETNKENVAINLSPDSYKAGDVNNDGKITATDARLALRCSVNLENIKPGSTAYTAADVNCDGKITASDARKILRASVGLEKL